MIDSPHFALIKFLFNEFQFFFFTNKIIKLNENDLLLRMIYHLWQQSYIILDKGDIW